MSRKYTISANKKPGRPWSQPRGEVMSIPYEILDHVKILKAQALAERLANQKTPEPKKTIRLGI